MHLTFGPQSILLDGRDARLDLFGVFSVTGQASWGDVVRRDPHLRYEPPEAVRGDELDARSNVYSLAAILVHALTGKEPFPQADPMLIEYAHISQPPPKPSERDPRLPPELDALVARGMAKDADERPASAGELLAEAAALLAVGQEAVGTAVLPNPAPESVAPNPTEGSPVEPPAAPPSEAEPAQSPPPKPPDPAPAVAATAPPPAPAVRPPAAEPSRSRAVLDAWFADTGETSGRPPTATPPAPIPPPAEEPTFYRPPLRVRLRPFLPLLAAVVVGAVFGLLVGMPDSQPTVAPARAPADLRVVQRLDLVRERLRSDMALALTPAEQADVAKRLATAHGVAATRLRSPELESAAQRLSDAYAAMAVAARDESAEVFASAADEVSAAEDDLTDASASGR